MVKTVKEHGHTAVAITDHGNVQGFPEAMLAADKTGMKVIYGMEAYFVDDTARAIYGNASFKFESDEFIVFDIETKLSQQQKIADTIELALQQAEAMRQSILKKAFEGEL